MQIEMISQKQSIYIITLFIFGSSLILGVSTDVEQDSWLALLVAIIYAVPVMLMYSRIMKLYPETDFFELIAKIFPKVISKIITAIMTWYALHLTALVLRNFSEFIQLQIMTETPQLPIMVAMLLLTVYMALSGIETLARWTLVILPVVFGVILLTCLLSINQIDLNNIFPIASFGVAKIAFAGYQLFTFPFAETVIFLGLACSVKKDANHYRIFIYSLLFSASGLMLVLLRNTVLLGPQMMTAQYFPSYIAVRIINIGQLITRVEGSISMNLILSGIVKISVSLIVAAKGITSLFGFKAYRSFLLPVSLLALALAAILYPNIMEMVAFINIYQYYAIPMQIIIPLFVWITAEIKSRKALKSGAELAAA